MKLLTFIGILGFTFAVTQAQAKFTPETIQTLEDVADKFCRYLSDEEMRPEKNKNIGSFYTCSETNIVHTKWSGGSEELLMYLTVEKHFDTVKDLKNKEDYEGKLNNFRIKGNSIRVECRFDGQDFNSAIFVRSSTKSIVDRIWEKLNHGVTEQPTAHYQSIIVECMHEASIVLGALK